MRHFASTALTCAWVLLLSSPVALARGGERFVFRFPLAVEPRDAPQRSPLPSPVTVSHEGGEIVVRDTRRPAEEQVRLRFPVGVREGEWMPWSRVHGDVLVFAWREFPNGPTAAHGHDVLRGVDLPTGRERWKLQMPFYADGVLELSDQRILVEATQELVAIEVATGKQVWRIPAAGSAKPMILRDALLVAEPTRLVRLDPSNGKEVWSTGLAGPDGITVLGGVLYAVEFASQPENAIEARMVRLDPETGRVLERRALHTYRKMHDVHRARVSRADDVVEIELMYVILD